MRKIKKFTRSFIAILCCTSMVIGSAGMLAKTVKAAETLPTDFTTVTPRDLGFADGATTKRENNTLSPLTTMNKVIFDADVKYSGLGQYIGYYSGQWVSMKIGTTNTNELSVYNDGLFTTEMVGWSSGKLIFKPAVAIEGATTLVNVEFNLKVTTEQVDSDEDGTTDDLKLGFWFNNKLYNDTYLYVVDGFAKLVNNAIYLNGVTVESPIVEDDETLETLPTDFTTVTPKELGFADGATTGRVNNTLSPLTTMNKVVFDADVKYTGLGQYIGYYSGQWVSMKIGTTNTNELSVLNDGLFTTEMVGWSSGKLVFDPAVAIEGATTLVNVEFNLKVTTEQVDSDEDGTADDLKLGFWFNNKLYANTYLYVVDGFAKLVNNAIYLNGVTVESPIVEDDETIETLPTDFTTVTPKDLGFADGATTGRVNNTLSPLTTMNKVIFDADVKYTGLGQYIGYYSGQWVSMKIGTTNTNEMSVYNDGLFTTQMVGWLSGKLIFEPAVAIEGATTLVNVEFNLKVTTEQVDSDEDGTADDLKLGFWFNNKLYANTYLYVVDGFAKLVNNAIYLNGVTVESPIGEGETPETLPTDFTEITAKDFGFTNGATTEQTWQITRPVTSMHKVLFDADVTFTGVGQYIGYGCTDVNQWAALKIGTTGQDTFGLINEVDIPHSEFVLDDFTFNPAIAIEGATTLQGIPFNFKITTEAVDANLEDADNTANDLKLGFWFNNKLYNNTYIYVEDGFEYLGTGLYLKGVNVTLPIDVLEELPTDFTVVTPSDYGFDEVTGTLPQTWNTETPVKSMDKVMLNADVKYAAGTLGYANISTWFSLRFTLGPGGFYLINDIGISDNKGADFVMENIQFDPQRAIGKSTFVDQEFNLKVTTEAVDSDTDGIKDDLKLGIWFNDKLYGNMYIYVQNGFGELGTDMYLKGDVFVSILPVQGEAITPPTFPEITFSDFNIADGKYSFNEKDLAILGKYKEGFANKTFVGTVNYSNELQSSINFGGQASGWEGVQLKSFTDGALYFMEAYGRFKPILINKDYAGVDLVESNLDVKLSFEVTDLDGDQEADDVRFWLYLGGKLYKNKPIVKAIDYAQYLGNFLGIYANAESTSVTIASKDLNRPKIEVDFSIVGFTKDWATTLGLNGNNPSNGSANSLLNSGNKSPYTADYSMVGTYLVTSVVALAVLLLLYYEKRRNVD